MLWNGTYKKILEGLPSGVFVFDDKLKVKYTNVAFRRSFSEKRNRKARFPLPLLARKRVSAEKRKTASFAPFVG